MAKHVLSVFVSVTLLVLLVVQSESSPLKVCCTQYHEKQIPEKWLKYYIVQDINFCNIKAIILVTVKNKLVCVNPESLWVKQALESVPKHKILSRIYAE